VKAELSKIQRGGVPSGRGSTRPLGPVPEPTALELPPLAPPEPAVEAPAPAAG
jgi:hypothetical protein